MTTPQAIIWGVAGYPPGTRLATRILDAPEWVWLESGSATLSVGRQQFPMDTASVALLQPGQRHGILFTGDLLVRQGYVQFRGPCPDGPWVRQFSSQHICRRLLPSLPQLLKRQDPQGRVLATKTLELASLAWNDASEGSVQQLHPVLDRMAAWVAEHWLASDRSSIPLPDVARAAGVSVSHLDRLVRQSFGLSPSAALRRIRLHQAAIRLRSGENSITAIAQFAGFTSPFAFSKAFRAVYGQSPSSWKTSDQVAQISPPSLEPLIDRIFRLA